MGLSFCRHTCVPTTQFWVSWFGYSSLHILPKTVWQFPCLYCTLPIGKLIKHSSTLIWFTPTTSILRRLYVHRVGLKPTSKWFTGYPPTSQSIPLHKFTLNIVWMIGHRNELVTLLLQGPCCPEHSGRQRRARKNLRLWPRAIHDGRQGQSDF